MATYVTITNLGTTKLARPLNVEHFEVAITRLVLPKEYYNLGNYIIRVYTTEGWIEKEFPAGHYESLSSLVVKLQHVIGIEHFELSYDADRLALSFRAANDRLKLQLPILLSEKLNVPQVIRGLVVSSKPITIMNQFMFVKSDCIHSQFLNSAFMPFLYVAHDHHSTQYVKSPVFVKVNKSVIDAITLSVVNENNRPVKFMVGTILVTLAFRKCA